MNQGWAEMKSGLWERELLFRTVDQEPGLETPGIKTGNPRNQDRRNRGGRGSRSERTETQDQTGFPYFSF